MGLRSGGEDFVKNICANSMYQMEYYYDWSTDEMLGLFTSPFQSGNSLYDPSAASPIVVGETLSFGHEVRIRDASFSCSFYPMSFPPGYDAGADPIDQLDQRIGSYDLSSGDNQGEIYPGWNVQTYESYNPSTKIKDLPVVANMDQMKILHRRTISALQKLTGEAIRTITLSCGINSQTARITNVKSFTNLRQQAGNGRVIGQVPLGATVSVVNPGQFLRYDRCAAACNGTNQNAIKQCIDNNDVWIEVDYNGRRGFLSRKFLE